MTTKTLAEIERMNKAGMNDLWISERLNYSVSCVNKWRKKLGLPSVRKNRNAKIYTVYDGTTEQYLCEGTSRECAKALGMAFDSFYSALWLFKSGKYKKYIFYEVKEGDIDADFED